MDFAVLGHESRGLQARIRQGFRARVFRMTICLAHMSALQYWRAVRCGFRPKPRAARVALPAKTNRSEIASLLGEREGTIKSRARRAKMQLKAFLTDDDRE